MRMSQIAFLGALITLHYGECSYLRTVEVRQINDDYTISVRAVAVFQLHAHSTATECFAWLTANEWTTEAPTIVPKSVLVPSPAAAVRRYARCIYQELAA